MQAPDEGIVNRIRHLLAMAEHENSNQHEAALALEHAQRLLLQHNLSRASVLTSDGPSTPTEGACKVDWQEKTNFAWKSALVGAIARANLCRTVKSPSTSTLHLFGRRENVQSVLAMYLWVTEQLEGMALAGYKAYQQDDYHPDSRARWRTDFFLGAIETINKRLQKPYEAFAQGDGKALIVVNKAMVDAAVTKTFPSLHKSAPMRHSMGQGYGAGKEAGATVSFAQAKRITGTLQLGAGR